MTAGVDVLTLTANPIPRTLEMALTGIRDLSLINTPPAARQPILTYVGEYEEAAVVGGDPARAAARGTGVLRAQLGPEHRGGRGAAARPRPRGPDRGRPRADGRGHPRAGGARLLGEAVRRARVHDHHRVGHRHAHGEHPRGRPRRPSRVWVSSTSCAVGWGGPGSAPTPTCSTRPTGCCPRRPTSGCGPSASRPSSAAGSRSPCATSRSGGRATCSGGTSRVTSPPSATTSTCRWWPRRWPR